MNVVRLIKGREAIPVRAVPMLTYCGIMSPDKLAGALARDVTFDNLHDLQAYQLVDGLVHAIAPLFWKNRICRQIAALSETINAKTGRDERNSETEEEAEGRRKREYDEWHRKVTDEMPAEAFVWKDEYEPIYNRIYGPGSLAHLTDASRVEVEALRKQRGSNMPAELNFLPLPSNPEMKRSVQESLDALDVAIGFKATTPDKITVSDHAGSISQVPLAPPVVTVGASNGTGWAMVRPKRYPGYRKPLYDLMKAALIAGQPCPNARDVLDAWKLNPPLEVFEVTNDGLKYYDANGNAKSADLAAIRRAIERMTT